MEFLKGPADCYISGACALTQTVSQVNFEADFYPIRITIPERHSHTHLYKNMSQLLSDFLCLCLCDEPVGTAAC